MIHQILPVGAFQCNCHILADESTREAILIDPGDNADEILAEVERLGVQVKTLIHTHGHLDHIMGTRALKEATGAEILLHRGDSPLYESVQDQARFFGWNVRDPLRVDRYLQDGEAIEVERE
jgi:glyoxylase-like metal-dependent hydrolase (beta-lactamase superfamily II)